MMYYLELIERFWSFNQTANAGSTAIAMYLYLLKTAKDNDGYFFMVSDVVVSNNLGLTRKTVKCTKEKLRDLGLIEFQIKNGVPCSYRLLVNYNLQISKSDKIRKSKAQKTPVFREAVGVESIPLATLQAVSPPEIAGTQNNSLSHESPNDNNPEIPALEEFIAFSKTLEIYESCLDHYIKDRYDSWVTSGWRNVSGRPITNWQLSLKSILPFIKNAQQDNQISIDSIPNIRRPNSKHVKGVDK